MNREADNQIEVDRSDGFPLPELCEGLLDVSQVKRLFTDLAALTQVVAILEKGGEQAYGQAKGVDLETACRRLLSRQCRALQIRYYFDGAEWTDTLLSTPAGIRAVRCRHSSHGS